MEKNLYFKHGNFKNWLLKEPKLKKGDFMKNKILATILLLASCVFAQYEYDQYGSNQYGADPYGAEYNTQQTTYSNQQTEYSAQRFDQNPEERDPYWHAHRGFYFAPSLTAAYTTLKHTETYRSKKEEYTADAFMFPYLEIRLGGSIAGVASIYGAVGLGTGTGTVKRNVKESRSSYYDYYDYSYYDDDDFYNKGDVTMLRLLFGAGVDFYPIQDKENPMYGLFAGLTVGIMIDGAFYKRSNDRDDTVDHDYINYAFRFEVGKDWWFSRRWSVGIAFNYTLGKYSEDDHDYYDSDKDECSGHTFGLTVRLAH